METCRGHGNADPLVITSHKSNRVCVEQILRPRQFCNLSQIVAREGDTEKDLLRKIRLAAIIGTIQSSLDDFKFIDGRFAENCQEERLLGVSISGIMDNELLASGDEVLLKKLKRAVIDENKKWAERMGINPSTSTTCIKPDGNTSVLYDSAPGIHGRFAPYYLRRMRVQKDSPIGRWAMDSGIPVEPAFGETWDNCKTLVLTFPVKSPAHATLQGDRGAIEQLDNWLRYKVHYTETNPSVTITYKPEEIEAVAMWLYKNQENVVGLSFLPASDAVYQQMPYEEITEAQYLAAVEKFEQVDPNTFWLYENNGADTTETVGNFACTGGACLID